MSNQTTPRTLRDILTPVVGAAALRDAEARVYDRDTPIGSLGNYQCRDGFCAVGILWRGQPYTGLDLRFPDNTIVAKDAGLTGEQHRDVSRALKHIINANDNGRLTTPRSLTALLDSEVTR